MEIFFGTLAGFDYRSWHEEMVSVVSVVRRDILIAGGSDGAAVD